MNRDLADAFVEALAGSADTPMTWQTFDDSKAKRKRLARILHGTLADYYDELGRLNDDGAGVFATINETDFRGRKASNIVRPRAVFGDDDRGDLRPVVPPSFSTRTRRGANPFWLLAPGQLLSRFKQVQSRIIDYYKSDKTAIDLPRVMRLPGFYHRKEDPVMVDFIPGTGRLWTIDELLEAHPVIVEPEQPAVASGRPVTPRSSGGGRQAALLAIVADKAAGRDWTVGNRHGSAIETATHARKIGLEISTTCDLVADLLVASGKTEEEAGVVVAWAWANVAPDADELAERPPEEVAARQLRRDVDPLLVVDQLRRWFRLTYERAVEIVDQACVAELARRGVTE